MSYDTFDKSPNKWVKFWIVRRRTPRLFFTQSDKGRNSPKICLVQNIQGTFAGLATSRHLVDAAEVRTVAGVHTA